mmetsp:Transcript_5931/g.11736  ORF Transcript_5931/g.11736 Transcript_5931/m.11736 type:complete len:251 (-) Transcript_5931:187-939(-)
MTIDVVWQAGASAGRRSFLRTNATRRVFLLRALRTLPVPRILGGACLRASAPACTLEPGRCSLANHFHLNLSGGAKPHVSMRSTSRWKFSSAACAPWRVNSLSMPSSPSLLLSVAFHSLARRASSLGTVSRNSTSWSCIQTSYSVRHSVSANSMSKRFAKSFCFSSAPTICPITSSTVYENDVSKQRKRRLAAWSPSSSVRIHDWYFLRCSEPMTTRIRDISCSVYESFDRCSCSSSESASGSFTPRIMK